MYSHGASARAGIGKRGHGGRNYRPPPDRRDPSTTPPPLKQCGCLLEFHIGEYRSVAPQGRAHTAFGGRRRVEDMERHVRSNFCVHLIIPGRKQTGPVAVVGRNHREAVPAAAYLLHILSANDTNLSAGTFPITGRVFLNTKRPDQYIAGQWQRIFNVTLQPQWLYRPDTLADSPNSEAAVSTTAGARRVAATTSWCALACTLESAATFGSVADEGNGASRALQNLSVLDRCVENIMFRMGNDALSQVDVFVNRSNAFCVGDARQSTTLYSEIVTAQQSSSSSSRQH